MHALHIEIISIDVELALQISGVPEKEMVKEFASSGADQWLDEGMCSGNRDRTSNTSGESTPTIPQYPERPGFLRRLESSG